MKHTENRCSGLYVHVPFCRRKCAYCDFASISCGGKAPGAIALNNWQKGILQELAKRESDFAPFETLYIGGGTPSLLAPERLCLLIHEIKNLTTISANAEITLEANPCDLVLPGRIEELAATGINRLSIGIQSFSDQELQLLGRPHDRVIARSALNKALSQPGLRVSVDLIFGLPGQSLRNWRNTLEEVAESGVGHLSAYQLTWAEGTTLTRASEKGVITPVSARKEACFLQLTHTTLESLGIPAYEVCSFATSAEDKSRHNINYWNGGDYLGLGPGAHSFSNNQRPGIRSWNPASLTEYLRRICHDIPPDGEVLTSQQRALELLFLGLRQTGGFDLSELEYETSIPLRNVNQTLLDQLIQQNLLVLEGNNLRPTAEGIFRADGLAQLFNLETSGNRG